MVFLKILKWFLFRSASETGRTQYGGGREQTMTFWFHGRTWSSLLPPPANCLRDLSDGTLRDSRGAVWKARTAASAHTRIAESPCNRV